MKLESFRLERYFAKYEFTTPYILCSSDCQSLSVGELLGLEEVATDEFFQLWLGYTDSRGNLELRKLIATLDQHINSEQILVHAGAEEAIFNFMHVVLDPGDHVIVHAPYYQSLGEIARSIGTSVTEWKADSQHNWQLDMQFLVDNLRPNTKVVIVNFPHNPTGFLPDRKFLLELSQLSDKWGFIVFSDEVYRGLEYKPEDQLPTFSDTNNRAVSLGVMSKTYGLAGLRVGWVATQNTALLERLAAFKDYTSICSSAPSEFLAALALRHRQQIVDRNLEIIRDNILHLDAFFARFEDLFEWKKPIAGPIAFPRYRGASVERFCSEIRRKAGVLLLPGTLYGEEYDCFRVGFGRTNLPEGLKELEKYLLNAR